MSIWKVYRYEDQVLVPTMVVSEEGAFVETQPVSAVSVESAEEVTALLKDTLAVQPAPAQAEDLNNPELSDSSSQPVLLEILGIKHWKDFEKKAILFTLHRTGNQLTMHVTGRGADGMWSIADSQRRSFSMEDDLDETCLQIAGELISRKPVNPPVLGLPGPRRSD